MDEHYDPAAERRKVAAQRREAEAAFEAYLCSLVPSPAGGAHVLSPLRPAGRAGSDATLTLEPVRVMRRRHGWTQAELALRAGLTTSCIGRLERGLTVPSLATVILLARAFAEADGYPASEGERQAGALWRSR